MRVISFSEVGSVGGVREPFISQEYECDVFCMSKSAEKSFTKALHLSDPWEVFSADIYDTEIGADALIRTFQTSVRRQDGEDGSSKDTGCRMRF